MRRRLSVTAVVLATIGFSACWTQSCCLGSLGCVTYESKEKRAFTPGTPEAWDMYTTAMDGLIQDELEGQPVYGAENWNEFWLETFRYGIEHDVPDRQKGDDYIINRRRELGLPEIEGYPFEDDAEENTEAGTKAGGEE